MKNYLKKEKSYFSDYSKSLLDHRWINKRNGIVERDKNCQMCDSFDNLEVHHLIYFPKCEPWEYDDVYLLTLCRTCHNKWHSSDYELTSFIKTLQVNCIWPDEILSKLQTE